MAWPPTRPAAWRWSKWREPGFAAGCNLGLRLAHARLRGDALLNNDTIVEPGALDQLVQRLALHNDCFACLPI